MPEGDTVYKLARALSRYVGKPVQSLWTRVHGEVDRVRGQTLTRSRAHGKHLLLELDGGDTVRVHLGMHGRWRRYAHEGSAARYPSLRLRIDGDWVIGTRLAQVELLTARDARRALRHLGPDLTDPAFPFAETVRRARAARHRDQSVAQLLLDQRVAAGIGNVYKSEVLFLERVHPALKTNTVTDQVLERLFRRAHQLIAANLGEPGGESRTGRRTLRAAEKDAPRFWVYGRHHQGCLQCEGAIALIQHGQPPRSTYFCPVCQVDPGSKRSTLEHEPGKCYM